jgi:hypothetical protein
MAIKTKGRAGWHQTTPEAFDNRHATPAASRIKALIVLLAVWGLIPVGLADWLIRRLQLGSA